MLPSTLKIPGRPHKAITSLFTWEVFSVDPCGSVTGSTNVFAEVKCILSYLYYTAGYCVRLIRPLLWPLLSIVTMHIGL